MINLDIAIYEVNMTELYEVNMAELLAKFWIELCKIDDDPNTDDADVLAELTCQKKAIDK